MPYRLTTEKLNDYLCSRVNSLHVGRSHPLVVARLHEDGKVIDLTEHRGYKFLVDSSYIPIGESIGFDRIHMAVDPHKAGVHERDFEAFLERMIDNDLIFQTGQALAGHSIPSDILKRERHFEGIMPCSIINRRANVERVKKAIYEYMFRPILYYALKGAGHFQS
jgi:hypothetical protein